MKPVTLLGALLALQTIPYLAHAAPATYGSAKCGALNITNDTDATLVRDHEDCRLVWVFPPTAGTAEFTNFDGTANLNLCQELKETQRSSLRITRQIDETSKRMDNLDPAREAADQALAKATAKVQEGLKSTQMQQMRDIQDRKEAIHTRMEELVTASVSCGDHCDTIRDERKNLAAERIQLGKEEQSLRKQYLAEVKDYEKALAAQKSAQAKRDAVMASVNAIRDEQTKYRNSLHQMMRVYSTYGAGTAYVNYDTGWDAAVKSLNAKYGSEFEFRKVATKDARIYANVVSQGGEQTYLSSLPAILGYSMNGLKYVPYGEETVPGLSSMPSVLGGSVSLSLVGGCPLYFENFIEADQLKPAGTKRNNYAFAISATYNYPSVYRLKMTASYNLYKFYEKIVESSSSGGFFSSHTSTSIVENTVDRDAFNIDWKVEDPDSMYDEKKRAEIGSDLKKELIGRVLGMTAEPQLQAPALTAVVPAPGEHGAVILANGLDNTCGRVNLWCTAGSWVLRGLNGIFGSDSASSSFRSTTDKTATETWNAETVRWNAGAVVFVPRK